MNTGKLVRGSLYLHASAISTLDDQSLDLLHRARAIAPQGDASSNVYRINKDGREVAFLFYPSFDSDWFPPLQQSWLVTLDDEPTASFRDYSKSLNPPILHRKELLLPVEDERRASFEKITKEAESIGLFERPERIGFYRDWMALIAEKGYSIGVDGFVPIANEQEGSDEDEQTKGESSLVEIARHRTALSRTNFSAPIQALARLGLLTSNRTVFDYGCGKGDDLRGLIENGHIASGWDPHFNMQSPIINADLVNLGFVLNVIEDREERDHALRAAYALAQQALVIAVMLAGASSNPGKQFRDGFITQRGTFQKYFTQSELKEYIETALGRPALLVAPGVAIVFANDDAEQTFLSSSRASRAVLRAFSVLKPPVVVRKRARELLFEQHAAVLEEIWLQSLSFGRVPDVAESPEFLQLVGIFNSPSKAKKMLLENFDNEMLIKAAKQRSSDLEVYFALQVFGRRQAYKTMPLRLQRDIKHFFGNHASAAAAGKNLLAVISDIDVIEDACSQAASQGLGHYIPGKSLQLHTSLVDELPPILRVYVGAATQLYGDVRTADLIKIHTRSGKMTVLRYDDFENSPAPSLKQRVKILLRKQDLEVFDYETPYEPTILLNKSVYIHEEYPQYSAQIKFDEEVKFLGIRFPEHGPTGSEFESALKRHRLKISGFNLEPADWLPELSEQCSPHFSYGALIHAGETQQSSRLPNAPIEPASYNALHALANQILEPVVDYFGGIEITFGFCSAALAKLIPARIAPQLDQHAACERKRGGALICERGGAAVDFLVRDEDMFEVALWITGELPFDRMYVYGADKPLHVSYSPQPAKEVVFVRREGKKTIPFRLLLPLTRARLEEVASPD